MYLRINLRKLLLTLAIFDISHGAIDNSYSSTQISSSECYDNYGQARVSRNDFVSYTI